MSTMLDGLQVPTRCELCGEPIRLDRDGWYAEEVGEFWKPEENTSVLAHAQCGLGAGLDPA